MACHLDQQIPDRCFILLVTLQSKIAYYTRLITVMEWVQSGNNILYHITVYLKKPDVVFSISQKLPMQTAELKSWLPFKELEFELNWPHTPQEAELIGIY